jgi:hypothetical protein
VSHAPDVRKVPVEFEVRGKIGGGTQIAFDDRSLKIADDHVLGLEFFVRDTAGLNRDETLVAVETAGIAEGIDDESAANQFQICFEHLFAERLQQHG